MLRMQSTRYNNDVFQLNTLCIIIIIIVFIIYENAILSKFNRIELPEKVQQVTLIVLLARLHNVERNCIRLFLVACFSSPTSFAVWDIADVQEMRSCKKGPWLSATLPCATHVTSARFSRALSRDNGYIRHARDGYLRIHYPFSLFFSIFLYYTSANGKITIFFSPR